MIGLAFSIFGVLAWVFLSIVAVIGGGMLMQVAWDDEDIKLALGGLTLVLLGVFSFCMMLAAMVSS